MGASTPEIGHQIGVGGEFECPGRSFETGVARASAWEARDRETVELVRPTGYRDRPIRRRPIRTLFPQVLVAAATLGAPARGGTG